MKKIFGFVMAALLVVGFIGCTDPNTSTDIDENASANESENSGTVEAPGYSDDPVVTLNSCVSEDGSTLIIYDVDVKLYKNGYVRKTYNNINRFGDTYEEVWDEDEVYEYDITYIDYILVTKTSNKVTMQLCYGRDVSYGDTGFNRDGEDGCNISMNFTYKNSQWYWASWIRSNIKEDIYQHLNVAELEDYEDDDVVDTINGYIADYALDLMEYYGFI